MTEVVIDTNVLLVADGLHEDVSVECHSACVERLQEIKASGTVVIDDEYRILLEYQNKLSAHKVRDAGSAFLKWLLQNAANPNRVAQVHLTETQENTFAEFPVAELAQHFDLSDRKFPAVANAHPAKPPILQATDSKWLKWWQELAEKDIQVEFLCPGDICRFFAKKFPQEDRPEFPATTLFPEAAFPAAALFSEEIGPNLS
jgi:hypothetical protein